MNYGKAVDERRCYACDDASSKTFRGRPVCMDCFNELRYGKIKNQNVNFCGGRGTKDDQSPWGENAVREMEDGR